MKWLWCVGKLRWSNLQRPTSQGCTVQIVSPTPRVLCFPFLPVTPHPVTLHSEPTQSPCDPSSMSKGWIKSLKGMAVSVWQSAMSFGNPSPVGRQSSCWRNSVFRDKMFKNWKFLIDYWLRSRAPEKLQTWQERAATVCLRIRIRIVYTAFKEVLVWIHMNCSPPTSPKGRMT